MSEAPLMDVDFLARSKHRNPHTYLGLHNSSNVQKIVRAWRPRQSACKIRFAGEEKEMEKIHASGVFTYEVPSAITHLDYELQMPDGTWVQDPYAFTSTFGPLDAHLFNKGVHYEIYNALGAHLIEHEGARGVKFSTWAPNARAVSLIGDFNRWDDQIHPMRQVGVSGVWELFLPGIEVDEKYKFSVIGNSGFPILKSDPYGNGFELRPKNASVVVDLDSFLWRDQEWMEKRKKKNPTTGPMNIYEMHLGSWLRRNGSFLNYREIASEVVDFCKQMCFTHLEVLPITEHPLDESWGYEVTGYFAPTSRYGTPEDFQYFINHLHMHDIGVILDWVPSHFPKDLFALAKFDGTPLYEYSDPFLSEHPEWDTYIFDYGKNEVKNFLIGSALFWLEKMHVDGLRVDAVASLLYLDYARQDGKWQPNQYGGNENLEAIEFIKHLNSIVHERCGNVLMIAEESTHFPGVTAPTAWKGLGFDLKWNLGWMNDTLRFMQRDFADRGNHHEDITFGLTYQYSERYVLPLSHDEVVHEKKSLFSKQKGDEWQQMANLRLLYAYSLAHPGKNLFFMGTEIAQKTEWNCSEHLPWQLLNLPMHRRFYQYLKEINHFYLRESAFWEWDFEEKGFAWIDYNDYDFSVISFMRVASEKQILCVFNFREKLHEAYSLPLRNVATIKEVMTSDARYFGGTGTANQQIAVEKDSRGDKVGVLLKIAPFSASFFEVEFD